MSWGLRTEGFRALCGADMDETALMTFARNFPEARALPVDLARLDPVELMAELNLRPGELDCLIGGPPCQGFSKNVPARRRFLADPQNLLVRRFVEFVAALRPKVFVMENVAELVNAYNQVYTSEVIETLRRFGYETEVRVMFAPEHGVPQRRRRAFFFGSRSGKELRFPAPTHWKGDRASDQPSNAAGESFVTTWEAISDLPRLRHGEGLSPAAYASEPATPFQERMRQAGGALYDHVARALRPKQLARLSALRPGEDARHLPPDLAPRSGYSGAYGRLSQDTVAPTITRWVFHPGSGRFGHPLDCRVITIREAARLQSFSDDFIFTGTYIQKSHQVGNAVPPLFLSAFAPEIRRHLA